MSAVATSQEVSMIWLNSEMVFITVAWVEAPVNAPASATIWSMTRRFTAWPTFATSAKSMKNTMKLQRTKRVVLPFSSAHRFRRSSFIGLMGLMARPSLLVIAPLFEAVRIPRHRSPALGGDAPRRVVLQEERDSERGLVVDLDAFVAFLHVDEARVDRTPLDDLEDRNARLLGFSYRVVLVHRPHPGRAPGGVVGDELGYRDERDLDDRQHQKKDDGDGHHELEGARSLLTPAAASTGLHESRLS